MVNGCRQTEELFGRILLGSESAPVFAKINTIDEQLHERFLPFTDLLNVLAAKIPIVLKRRVGELTRGISEVSFLEKQKST